MGKEKRKKKKQKGNTNTKKKKGLPKIKSRRGNTNQIDWRSSVITDTEEEGRRVDYFPS